MTDADDDTSDAPQHGRTGAAKQRSESHDRRESKHGSLLHDELLTTESKMANDDGDTMHPVEAQYGLEVTNTRGNSIELTTFEGDIRDSTATYLVHQTNCHTNTALG